MKPRNFPGNKLRRVAMVKWRNGETLTARESEILRQPKDSRMRIGKASRGEPR